jgi:hypothetical protein
MQLVILVISCLLINLASDAQSKVWTVKAGNEIKNALSPDVKFRYPQFVTGIVYFKDGRSSAAPLNLNLLNEEMQFIHPGGDTLSIANEGTIKYITINNDTFYYSRAYLELVSGNPLVKLAKKQRLKIGDVTKIGAYDQPNSTSAITSLSAVYTGAEVTKLSQRAEIQLLKETVYYIGDKYNQFLKANKKNVIKMFGRQEAAIEFFLKENNTRFYNEGDLKILIDFLQKLQVK